MLYIFDIQIRGSIFAISILNCIFIMVSLLIGLIISTAAKEQFIASMGAFTITFMPTMMLFGFILKIKSMPIWLQYLTHLFPARCYVSSIRTLIMVEDV